MCRTFSSVDATAGGRWRRQEGHHHLRTVPSAEVLPQDPDTLGPRAGEEVQVRQMEMLKKQRVNSGNAALRGNFPGGPHDVGDIGTWVGGRPKHISDV